ncbi:phage protein Gp36 family protein [Luteolibacter sp. LG18]|uniref:phage protein Gp36 family protein n=1 Tax=Luteolibacter sp. LG18 TaxID=2819286 RepID=UPI002B2F4CED|nr:hypothetical protein llg_07060 [Luteolibacter sp. LG18]BCU79665.1 hypothetical protein llg_43800 [Luteolibacter sp. LG18]
MWITLTTDALVGALSDTERTTYRTHVAVTGGVDPLPSILAAVTKRVRNAIRSWHENRLDPDPTTIADECEDAAICLIRYRLLSMIDEAVSEPRTNEWKDAVAFLKDVRAGRASIERPDENPEAPAPPPSPSPRIIARRKRFSRDMQNGI